MMSKILTHTRKMPGLVVGTSLQAARLHINAAARVTGQSGNEEWPLSGGFEGVEAAVETAVGGLFRDDAVVSRVRLRQPLITKLKEAGQLEAIAEQQRVEADNELDA